jgi:hypothetical protein
MKNPNKQQPNQNQQRHREPQATFTRHAASYATATPPLTPRHAMPLVRAVAAGRQHIRGTEIQNTRGWWQGLGNTVIAGKPSTGTKKAHAAGEHAGASAA